MIVHEFPYDAKLRLKRRSEMIPSHLSILDPRDTNTGTTPCSSPYSKNRPDCSLSLQDVVFASNIYSPRNSVLYCSGSNSKCW